MWRSYLHSFKSYHKQCADFIIRECRSLTLSPCCEVIIFVTIMEYTPWIICIWSLHIWCQVRDIFKNLKFSKLMKFWGPGEHFRQKCHRILLAWPSTFLTFWAFDWWSSLNINGFMAFLNSWPSYLIMIPMYRLWLHGLYGLYGYRCPLSWGGCPSGNMVIDPRKAIHSLVIWLSNR